MVIDARKPRTAFVATGFGPVGRSGFAAPGSAGPAHVALGAGGASTGGSGRMDPPPLLPDVARGDARAVQACIDRYGGLVWSLARRLLAAPNEREDAVQEIFVDLWRSAARYDPLLGPEHAFVVTIARRRLIDRVRAQRSRRQFEQPLDLDALDRAAATHAGHDPGGDAGLAARALAVLPARDRSLILLAVVEGLSHAEIAARVAMPLGTVKTIIRRGLLRVRAALEGRASGGER